MVKIRMTRMGRHRRPFFRIQAIDSRCQRDGAYLEHLGWYDPIATDPTKQLSLEADRIKYWLSVGAQPSETVADILGKQNLLPAKQRAEWEQKRAVDRKRVQDKKTAAAAAAPAEG